MHSVDQTWSRFARQNKETAISDPHLGKFPLVVGSWEVIALCVTFTDSLVVAIFSSQINIIITLPNPVLNQHHILDLLLTMGHIIDAVQVTTSCFVKHVLPTSPLNLQRLIPVEQLTGFAAEGGYGIRSRITSSLFKRSCKDAHPMCLSRSFIVSALDIFSLDLSILELIFDL